MLTCHCKTCERERRALRPKLLAVVVVVILAGLLAVASVGCSTVVPRAVNEPVQPSFDGNEQNSGIVASTESGFIVTAYFRDRYNALVAVYGKDFTVPLKRDAGLAKLSPTEWLIDRQHLVQFLDMAAWQRSGLPPKTK